MEGKAEGWESRMELVIEKTVDNLMKIVRDYYEELEEFDEEEEVNGESKTDGGQNLNEYIQLDEEDQKIKVDGDFGLGNYVGFKQITEEFTGLKEEGNKMEDYEKELSSAIKECERFLKKEDLRIIIKTFMDNNNRILWQEKFLNFGIVKNAGWIKEDGIYYFKNKWGKEGIVLLLYDIACYDTKD